MERTLSRWSRTNLPEIWYCENMKEQGENMAKAVWNGKVVAESDKTQVVEGNIYFPHDSIDREFFRSSSTISTCPWKGQARYYTILVDGQENSDAAWYYPDPKPAARAIKNHVAFWRGVEIEK
jgi:uncharacterized protein (DUF427 family)